ncbi:hypothetical protein [Occallatibacter riparius]|uniref:Pycsar effector protein domain-containing protein n=1 Tax=Occallatibacter riparius TaxID=1002689 RepID=A0A9J7BPV3_9BACT|nr:hypothetical protein [Occallatibacter riparius]UWZ82966.1 hypothetical protein MOP44_20635 [Occallatibacter riparius]
MERIRGQQLLRNSRSQLPFRFQSQSGDEEVLRDRRKEGSSQKGGEESSQEEMTPQANEMCERGKAELLTDACEGAAKHYEDYANAFVNIDTKAAAITTVGGIVLAAVVAFLKDGQVPEAARGNCLYVTLIIASPVLALIAIIFSLFGARVTEVVEPFDAPERIREARNLADLDCNEFSQQHIIDYYRAQSDHWSNAIRDIREVVRLKANRVLWAQYFLIAALSVLVIIFVVLLLRTPATPLKASS